MQFNYFGKIRMTGNTFWEIQSSLPPGGKPLAYILYADKSCLSSFGTAKGYPVMARCGNLSDEIRNGKNFGGGCVVGWLPIVEEEEDNRGKPSWINFKRVVWHEAFQKILGPITQYSCSGYAFKLPNSEKVIILYLFILILSADYEEHCMMTLTRGVRAHYPCPVCLVPLSNLSDLSINYPLRTTESMKEIYERAYLLSAEKAEDLLKLHGLRKVPNVFWEIERSDPYRACMIKSFPRWRNLTHFTSVFSFDFADGKKYEHMSRQILFAAQAVLTKTADPAGYLLLQCMRSHLELDVYAAMNVHTENTIKAGQSIMQVFRERMQVYSGFKNPTTWDIPKMHTQKHLFSDIQAKGVTKNYNTKINESMHGPLKKAYQTQTNFKNVAEQILRTDHRYNVAMQIQQGIDRWKKHMKYKSISPEAHLHGIKNTSMDPHTIFELENAFSHDLAYNRFQIRLEHFMLITIYQTLSVHYQSYVNLKQAADLLWCSPMFYNHPRYDGVIINTTDGLYVAQLIQLFECEFDGQKYPLALVHPYDAPVTDGHLRWKHQRDKDLGFYRVRARPRIHSAFVSIYSIIRGALLVADADSDLSNGQDYFIIDIIDTDMFL
ncbi:hypothetical protein ARMSODRAFT_990404 [Armillaria solidipes]|uniref:Uncharacterized protein n=1 Tax=Armillaria solidipes TaxID=1076256 RepID=A0A2H3AVW2_9AGAR|nr:hypothetical protein ARMSODRAFT_990404 [Armillaria solidipes]